MTTNSRPDKYETVKERFSKRYHYDEGDSQMITPYARNVSSEQLPSLVPHHHPPQSPMVLHHPQLILDHRSHIVKKDPPIVFPKRFAISLQAQNFILGWDETISPNPWERSPRVSPTGNSTKASANETTRSASSSIINRITHNSQPELLGRLSLKTNEADKHDLTTRIKAS
ncbi:hypothetical protein PGTUg99_032507 [Puccinia graminis f. sp. tritici]|uniref:Uncharacterized protein n=1 Tax=Puccinia graminis f. sp. tritici TaxID=56615 RepID=A0A5B0R7M5_PUCGR|nr:hypothetical protein PGTUg99_032507 [Puccinia graminis f. sp. tritici]